MKQLCILKTVLLTLLMSVGFAACGGDDDDSPTNETKPSVTSIEAVDLGLSVAWATCNVGANSPEEYGSYFAWGETSTKSEYIESNSTTFDVNYSSLLSQGIIGSNGILTGVFDAATANWGDKWRMPTFAEIRELINNCTWTWTTRNGVNGCIVTGSNGNSIFLPAAGYRDGSFGFLASSAGYYLSSSSLGGDDVACRLGFNSDGCDVYIYNRSRGQSVRPVLK